MRDVNGAPFIEVTERAWRQLRRVPAEPAREPAARPHYADGRWHEVPGLLLEHEQYEKDAWTPERDAISELMSEGDERPSGISGIDPRYFRVKAFLVQLGRHSLDIQRRRGQR